MDRTAARCLVLAGLLSCALVALAAETGGSAFLQEAIQGNLGEVKMDGLAQQKGTSQAIKDFGATLEKDHAAANQKAISAAKALGMSAPQEPGPEQKKVYQTLSGLSGKQFDQRFIKEMVEDHEKDIKKYTDEADKGDGQASIYAQEILPDLRKHLAIAQRLQSDPKSQGSSASR